MQPSFTYAPIKLHIAASLVSLGEACDLYIPIANSLVTILMASELSRPAKASSAKAPTLRYLLRLSPALAATQPCQTAVVELIIQRLQEYFTVYSYSPGFPELILPATVVLKRFGKQTPVHRYAMSTLRYSFIYVGDRSYCSKYLHTLSSSYMRNKCSFL